MAGTARATGEPLAPWQRHVANGAGTLLPNGQFRYRYVVVIVPRRAGKTAVVRSYGLTLGRIRHRSKQCYASHRRETAAAMWRDEWFPMLEDSPLIKLGLLKARLSNGSEAMTWKHTRSTFRLLPPDGDALRSFKADLVFVDEGREFGLAEGNEFERAALPTMATGYGGQFWILSNAGTAKSTWLAKWRDLGRASVLDPSSSIFYVEYSGYPGEQNEPIETDAVAELDAGDPAVWFRSHPGLGHHVNESAIAADHEVMPPDDFAAEYLGIWSGALVDQRLVAAWQSSTVPATELGGAVTFGIETDYERERTVIVAAGTGSAPWLCSIEIVDDRPHGPWVVPRLEQLLRDHQAAGIVWDAGGPVNALAHELAELPANLYPMRTNDVTAAAGAWHDRILGAGVEHRDDEDLLTAVAAARRRAAGGAWLFDRRAPGALPLLASALAGWRWADGKQRAPTAH